MKINRLEFKYNKDLYECFPMNEGDANMDFLF